VDLLSSKSTTNRTRHSYTSDAALRPGIATPPEEDRATATGDMHKNFVTIGPTVPEGQTGTQTDKLIAILRFPTGAELRVEFEL